MIYSGTVLSKTNVPVPLFNDGKPMHSKYNPSGEASVFANQVDGGFIVVAGIGGGFHIEALLSKLSSDFFIVAVESDKESLDFCLNLPQIKEIVLSKKIEFCTASDFESVFRKKYFPAAYPGFAFLPQRAWENHNQEICVEIKKIIEKGLKDLSSDFSVQSHFGKIWQRNIMINLAKSKKLDLPKYDDKKTAAVIAAGPSLDSSIELLKKHPDEYTIFSTDTAYGTLLLNGIVPDFVVSIDGQLVSSSHFFITPPDCEKSSCFVFDLCSNPSAVEIVSERGFRYMFIKSHHPLCAVLDSENTIPYVENGSGTVTIAACDFARFLGAKKIRIFGSDFSYNNGKPYCKGTYLDKNFSINSSRFGNLETQYSALMFRTELESAPNRNLFGDELKNPKTSVVLESYKETLLLWADKYSFRMEQDCLENQHNTCYLKSEKSIQIKINEWLEEIKPIFKESGQDVQASVLISNTNLYPFFPYVAWLRKKDGYNKLPFFELLKLAYTQLSRYTELYEK